MIHWSVDPILIDFGSVKIRWYGLLFASGFALGYWLMRRFFRMEGKPVENVEPLLITMVLGTSIGARLGHCLFYEPDVYLRDPWRILRSWEGGLSSHGALIGILIAIWIFTRLYKEYKFLWVMDRISIVVASAGALIRIGNFFNSEIIGRPTGGDWGVVFTRVDMIPRWPTQLIESAFYWVVFGVLYKIYHSKRDQVGNGFFLGLFLVLVFGFRILVEMLKENQVPMEANWLLNLGQSLSIPAVIFGAVLLYRGIKKPSP